MTKYLEIQQLNTVLGTMKTSHSSVLITAYKQHQLHNYTY